MQNEPVWLPAEEVIKINQDEVAATGEPYQLLSRNLLESAVASPINHYLYDGEIDILRLAVILIVAIARDHPFEQGNKRTGWTAGMMFMALNGYDITWDSEEIAQELVKLISGDITMQRFEEQIFYFVTNR
ncbi:type II toxin-antitoxin system death-on-curing family toxin [Mesorhizobium sp. 1M-11]|uniref:type II toxin-antitoxin system death-on-curing family toxin n=1 Tax=Mesorhizobium sp. 1M-11 TaxID=1529006 RepID=UPI0009E6761D|nr:type II toxin-antitoxin system death-on-curing family toxin [Mesorhizobium sp. 1M-11]